MTPILVSILQLFSTASFWQAPDWEGQYTFSKEYGQTVGGTAVVVTETLLVEADAGQGYRFSYEVSGYQTHYKINGYALAAGKQLTCYFSRVVEGLYYSADQIKPAQPFFILQYEQKTLLTRWLQPSAQKRFHPYFRQQQ